MTGYLALLAARLHCRRRGHAVIGVYCGECDLYEYTPQHSRERRKVCHYRPRYARQYRFIR